MKLSIESSVFMIFLIFCLFVLSLVFFESTITGNLLDDNVISVGKGGYCYKEGDYDKLKAGRVRINDDLTSFFDYCYNATTLIEYYCGKDKERNYLFKDVIDCTCRNQEMVTGWGGACLPTKEEISEQKKKDSGCKEEKGIVFINFQGEQIIAKQNQCQKNISIQPSCKDFNIDFEEDLSLTNINDITPEIKHKIERIITKRIDCTEKRQICNPKKGLCEDEFGFSLEPEIYLEPLIEDSETNLTIIDINAKKKFIEVIIEIQKNNELIKREIIAPRSDHPSFYKTRFIIPKINDSILNIAIKYIDNYGNLNSKNFIVISSKEDNIKHENLNIIKELSHVSEEDFTQIIKEISKLFNSPQKYSFKNFRSKIKSMTNSIELKNIKANTLNRLILLSYEDFKKACDKAASSIYREARGNFEVRFKNLEDIKKLYELHEENDLCSCKLEEYDGLFVNNINKPITLDCLELESRALKV